MRKVALVLSTVGTVLALVVLVRTFAVRSLQVEPAAFDPVAIDAAQAVERLSKALQFKSVSDDDRSRMDPALFEALHAFLKASFPRVGTALTQERVGDWSLLYTWAGTTPKAEPIILMGHMDVVPAAEDSLDAWIHPPFSGAIADGAVWGRGALDDKSSVLAILEAAEALLQAGFVPRRNIYFCFGGDEEVGGQTGAGQIVSLLQDRGVRVAFALDEGLGITDGIVPGMTRPLALIGLAEKGYLSLELKVSQEGGHSSTPPRETAIGILAKAVAQLEDHPMPGKLDGLVRRTFDYAGPEMTFPMRLLFSNLWIFGRLVERELARSHATDAGLRTSTAPTIFQAGVKDNVLPASARAVVNFRILPGDTVDSVMARTKTVIADERVALTILPGAQDPSPVSSEASAGFKAITDSIRQVFPEVAVAPALMIAASDSQHYAKIAKDQYRFAPIWLSESDLARIHGVNERIRIEDYVRAIQFFAQVIRNSAGTDSA